MLANHVVQCRRNAFLEGSLAWKNASGTRKELPRPTAWGNFEPLIFVKPNTARQMNTFSNKTYNNTTTGLSELNINTTDFCSIFHTKKTITQEDAQKRVGPWFKDEFSKWESEKENEPRFWTWYYNKYFPGTASSIIDCKLDDKCSVSSWLILTFKALTELSSACSLS